MEYFLFQFAKMFGLSDEPSAPNNTSLMFDATPTTKQNISSLDPMSRTSKSNTSNEPKSSIMQHSANKSRSAGGYATNAKGSMMMSDNINKMSSTGNCFFFFLLLRASHKVNSSQESVLCQCEIS